MSARSLSLLLRSIDVVYDNYGAKGSADKVRRLSFV